MRIFLSIFGSALFLVSARFGYCLLLDGKLSGTEFVSLVIAFAIIGLILAFASEVQEFSVAGNIVKLKEVKRDAEKSINELKSARTETFRFLLNLATRHPGGLSNGGVVDGRLNDFWSLYDQIIAFKCDGELSANILDAVNILLYGQLYSISINSNAVEKRYYGRDEIPEPAQLTIEALDNESVAVDAKKGLAGSDQDKIKKMLIVGLEEYAKLYNLREKYKNKT